MRDGNRCLPQTATYIGSFQWQSLREKETKPWLQKTE
jgi:hypothetical protein